jgi:pyruvate,water dikinase
MAETMGYLFRFRDVESYNPASVGRKFAALAKACATGHRVPPAFAVGTAAHEAFLRRGTWPAGLREELLASAAELGLENGVAVRSSAVSEDLERRSFAGQFLTFLHVDSAEELLRSVQSCWQGADAERVRGYVEQSGGPEPGGSALVGVIVQSMVQAASAGVAFSRNPLYPARSQVVVEAVRGLGDRLVSGHGTPYRGYVGEGGTEVYAPGGGREVRPSAATGPLELREWQEVAALARTMERCFGRPQDIEWGLDKQRELWLLQTRPISTLEPQDLEIPAGMWTRKIADDLWADRLSPFLASVMLEFAPRFDFSGLAGYLGVPLPRPTLAVIRGYLYVSSDNLLQVFKRLPERLRTPDARALFPPEADTSRMQGPGWGEAAATFLRLIALLLAVPGANPLLCAPCSRVRMRGLQRRIRRIESMPEETGAQVLAKIRGGLDCLGRIQEGNRWPYAYATLCTWALRWLMVDVAGMGHSDFLKGLGRGNRNVTVAIERKFRELASDIRNDPDLSGLFQQRPEELSVESMPGWFREKLHRFQDAYGCRSGQRSLLVPRWSENPDEVLRILQALLRQPERDGAGPDEAPAGPRDGRLRTLALRMLIRAVRQSARKFLDLREDLRFLLDRNLFLLRRSMLRAGEVTGAGEDVFFLDREELERLLAGKAPPGGYSEESARRRERFLQQVRTPTFYVDGHPEEEQEKQGSTFRGIGTSYGRASGRARIVSDPGRRVLGRSDILVAECADPGWTPILSTVAALVVEEGGLLNHCSIVARELGVPVVVGVRGATDRIPEGARITVDADQGTVSLDE